jgi:osmotically-inducible protein OsmY
MCLAPLWLAAGCAPLVVGTAAVTGAAVAHDRRSAGTVLDDQTIEFQALGNLHADKELYRQAHVNVTSYNRVALLTGEAPTEELKKRAAEIVRGIEKVRRVHNEIAIAAPSSFTSRSADTLLTGRVKAAMVGIKGFDPTRVKVVTENGVVYLMGLVTRAEAETATEAARTTSGVQRVVRIFEYVVEE